MVSIYEDFKIPLTPFFKGGNDFCLTNYNVNSNPPLPLGEGPG